MSDSWHCAKKPVFAAALWKKLDKKHKKVRENGAGKKMFLLCSRWLDHHLTTSSSQPVPCIVCTSQHPFITIKTSAGSCAHCTISGAVSWHLPVRHSSPTWLLRPTESYTTIFETPEPHEKSKINVYTIIFINHCLFLEYIFATLFSARVVLFQEFWHRFSTRLLAIERLSQKSLCFILHPAL